MIPMVIEKFTRRLAGPEGVENVSTLAVRDIPHETLGNGQWSKWEFTDGERAMIAGGANLYLIIYGERHPVVSLAVGSHIEEGEE